MPYSDNVVGVSSEQGLTILRPAQRSALGVLLESSRVDTEFLFEGLVLKIPDLDGSADGGAKPVSAGGEGKGVDDSVGVEGVQVLALVEVPEHGLSVLSTGSAQGTVGGDSDGVDVSLMSNVIGLQTAVSEVPDLDNLVPSGGHDDRLAGVGREANGRHPVGVNIILKKHSGQNTTRNNSDTLLKS